MLLLGILWLVVGVALFAGGARRGVGGPWLIASAVAWLVAGTGVLFSALSGLFLLPLALLLVALLALAAGWINLFRGLVFIAGLPGTILLLGTVIS